MTQIYEWTFELVSQSILRIGHHDDDLMLDEQGRPFLPGTSLTGALRNYCQRAFGEKRTSELFGRIGKLTDRSFLLFLVSDSSCSASQVIETRSGVSIDSRTGSSVKGALFQRVVVSAGATFNSKLTLKINHPQAASYVEMIEHSLSALANGLIRLGAYKSSGGGQFALRNGKLAHFDCSNPVSLDAYVRRNHQAKDWKPSERLQTNHMVQIEIVGQTFTPLLIGGSAPHHHEQPDRAHIRVPRNGQVKPIIPGTSFKGSLRSTVERIRNELQLDPAFETYLFGSSRSADNNSARFRGHLVVGDIELQPIGKGAKLYHRIAIHPLTGGTRDGAKLDEETYSGSFRSTLTLDLCASNEEEQRKHIVSFVLLLFALRDFANQRVNIGSGAAIGRGFVSFETFTVAYGEHLLTFDFTTKKLLDEKNWLSELDRIFMTEVNKQ
jgi:CRISPR/Cas system CSM-associated protein Csm3 (group 7 of RAMP superfamily)